MCKLTLLTPSCLPPTTDGWSFFSHIAKSVQNAINEMGLSIIRRLSANGSSIVAAFAFPPLLEINHARMQVISREANATIEKIMQSGKTHVWTIEDGDQEKPIGVTLQRKEPSAKQKHILLFLRPEELWQTSLPFIQALYEEASADVTCFNYNRFNNKIIRTGTFYGGEESLFERAKWQLMHLIKQRGTKPENIIFYGRGLGGTLATILAHRMAEHGDFNIVAEIAPKHFKAAISKHPYFPSFCLKFCPRLGWKLETQPALTSLKGKIISVVSDSPSELPLKDTIQRVLNKVWPSGSKLQAVITIKLTAQELKASDRPARRITQAIREHFQ